MKETITITIKEEKTGRECVAILEIDPNEETTDVTFKFNPELKVKESSYFTWVVGCVASGLQD